MGSIYGRVLKIMSRISVTVLGPRFVRSAPASHHAGVLHTVTKRRRRPRTRQCPYPITLPINCKASSQDRTPEGPPVSKEAVAPPHRLMPDGRGRGLFGSEPGVETTESAPSEDVPA